MKVFPDDLLYSREHVWVRVDGNMATIGITDYAQEKLGEAISIELPDADPYIERDLLDLHDYNDFLIQEAEEETSVD